MTDGCSEMVPEEETIVFADGPPVTVLLMELIMDD